MKNLFKQKTTWTNAEFIPLKISIALPYIIIGAYFSEFFKQHFIILFILFFAAVTWTMYLWITKMKKEN